MPVSIHGKEYYTVVERMGMLIKEHKEKYSINTDLVKFEGGVIVVKATLIIGSNSYTGNAMEEIGSSQINNNSALENAETSSSGRALAFLGLLTDGIPSAEEISSALIQQDQKLQTALRELDGVSHLGSYQEWITKHSDLFKKVKDNNPIAYKSFQEKFSIIKSTLETKGVINGRKSN